MKKYIDTNGEYSVGSEGMTHDNVPIQVAEELAKEIIEIFKNKHNLEQKI